MTWFVIFLILAVALWLLAGRVRHSTGLPTGQVVYSDTGAWGRVERPLFSQGLQLTGKPDYLVREGGALVPVEVKTGRAPASGAYATHIYQLAAYCALVQEAYGQRPHYGLIKYADKLLRVNYTHELETELLELLDEMRADADSAEVSRSHDSAVRCGACGFRAVCGQTLA